MRRRKPAREAELLKSGYPAYTTSVGWLGYSDEKIHRLCREALADGWTHFKVKVGGKPEDDLRRLSAVRAAIGPERKLMIDSNQRWDVDEAIARIKELSHLDLWWAEEPTHPDDVLGHARIAKAIAPVASRQASMAPIAWCSSSCCRPTPSASARSTAAASAA